jgi:arylsulfatase A-like enzyme
VGGYHREGITNANDKTDNAPLRGGKGMLYEGGVRVPFVFRWKGKIAPGTTSAEPIITVDLYPTFLEAAGGTARQGYTLDGVSLVGLLSGSAGSLDREALYWHFPGYLGAAGGQWRTLPGGAIRMGDYKLIEYFEDNHVELYNLKDDIGQKHDLSKSDPDRAKAMRQKLADWRNATGAKMPTPNTDQVDKPRRKGRKNAGEDE